jgi:peptide/nickel transport system ATP-binding protein
VAPVLEITNLSTHIKQSTTTIQAVGNVDLRLERGETLGVVGESGCGKSMTGLSIMRLLPAGGEIVSGSIKLNGGELTALPEREMVQVRGNEIAMIFQDPLTSLDPTKTIGSQVAEPVRQHRGASKKQAAERAVEVLALVGLPRPAERLDDYPHQLSGGMRQRVMIATALACEPKVLIADEPTTALDVTIQAQILDLLDDLKSRLSMAMILITHDMGVIAGHTDRVNVMYAGRIVETALTGELFRHMHHPYTQALLGSIPQLSQDRNLRLLSIPGLPPDLGHPPEGCRFAARCRLATDKCRAEEPVLIGADLEHLYSCWHPVDGPLTPEQITVAAAQQDPLLGSAVSPEPAGPGTTAGEAAQAAPLAIVADRAAVPGDGDGSGVLLELAGLVKEYSVTSGLFQRAVGSVHAVSGVSFSVAVGETFGLVGESGCGKTTIGKMVVGLERPTDGSVRLRGIDVSALHGEKLRKYRRDLQMMFQDPYASLDPRMRVGATVKEPLVIQGLGSRKDQEDRVYELLSEVGLPRNAVERFPHEFSGGQRQRIGLARALTLNPQVIVADEPVSALDVSIRAQVLNLMKRLQAAHGLTYIVISHDLAVVKYMADRIGVMYLGKLVELGSGADIYERHAHPYTAGLLSAIPIPDPAAERVVAKVGIRGELPSAIHPPSGCRFRTRCQFAQEICADQEPELRSFGPGHVAACHFPLQHPAGAGVSAAVAEPAATSAF